MCCASSWAQVVLFAAGYAFTVRIQDRPALQGSPG